MCVCVKVRLHLEDEVSDRVCVLCAVVSSGVCIRERAIAHIAREKEERERGERKEREREREV